MVPAVSQNNPPGLEEISLELFSSAINRRPFHFLLLTKAGLSP
jgi:hypothetical protein